MAGGKGERFWPLSTSEHPKQMLALVGDRPLITLAVERLDGLVPVEDIVVVTSAALVQATLEALPGLPPENVVGEPFGRDTAAACALALALVKARDPEAAFCILTADHIMGELDVFRSTLRQGFALALARPVLITIGIPPTFPSTGFGYIEAGDRVEAEGDVEFFDALRFVEKPDTQKAATYLETGRFYWNAGMFIWSVPTLESALQAHCPQLRQMCDRLLPTVGTPELMPALDAEYSKLEKISVDYALMEKAENIVMAKGVFPWDDVGSWLALENHFEGDASGNIVVGSCESIDSGGNIVMSNERLTALVGVRDLVVVQAKGATLVCRKDRSQDVKKLVKLLGEKGEYGSVL